MIWKNTFPVLLCILISACGGSGSSETQTDTNKTAKNQAPIAVITSSDTPVTKNKLVHFNASKSYDPDGDTLSYQWTLTKGSEQTPVEIEQQKEDDIAIKLTNTGKYVLTLIVSDGKLDSKPSQLEIALNSEATLVAAAGQDMTVKKGQVISLDGSESRDLDDVIISYYWDIIEKPVNSQANILKHNSAKTSFVIDLVGKYTVELRVQNESGDVATDTLTITSEPLGVNSAPVVVIKDVKNQIKPNEVILLDASESYDPDRLDTLSFAWEVVSQPEGANASLSTLFDAQTSFSTEVLGDYEVAITVTDAQGASAKAVYDLSVSNDNLPPTAELGEDINASIKPLELTCKSCFDPEGEPLTYQWQLVSRPEQSMAELQAPTDAVAMLYPDVAGEYAVIVSVSDGKTTVTSNPQTYYIDDNQKPVAQLAAPDVVYSGNNIELDASQSSDPNNDTLTYEWQVIEAPEDIQFNTTDDGKAFFTPTQLGDYIVSLRVYDGQHYSDPLTHTVQVKSNLPPVIVFQNDSPREAEVGQQVTFDASGSFDPDGESLTYQWSLDKPENSTAQLATNTLATTSLIADVAGIYSVNLRVSDAAENVVTKSVRLDVSDPVTILSGSVRGRILDSYFTPFPNAKLKINGKEYVSDTQGVFDAQVEVEEGAELVIETNDERLASATYTAPSTTQDGFVINFGDEYFSVKQPVNWIVFKCFDYSGPETFEVEFRLRSTFPPMNLFKLESEHKISFTFDESGRATKLASLPGMATFEMFVSGDVKIRSPSSHLITIYYSKEKPDIQDFRICNK